MNEQYVTYYSVEGDMTFIMLETCDFDGLPLKSEVTGFYFGKPNDEDTEKYKNKRTADFFAFY